MTSRMVDAGGGRAIARGFPEPGTGGSAAAAADRELGGDVREGAGKQGGGQAGGREGEKQDGRTAGTQPRSRRRSRARAAGGGFASLRVGGSARLSLLNFKI